MDTSTSRYLVLSGALVASLFTYCLLRNGILTTEDGWAFWEGSVSLLEDGSYTYLGGGSILWWPPLFSAYLAMVQAILGKTGFALAVAMCCLTFLNTAVWLTFLYSYFRKCATPKNDPRLWVGISFVILFVPNCSIMLYSQCLLLAFIGLLLLFSIQVPGASGRRYTLLVGGLAIAEAGALLTHNSAVVFIPAVTAVLWFDDSRKLSHRLIACGAYGVSGAAPYLAVRTLLQQTHSHPLGSESRYSLIEYLCQSLGGLGQFFCSTSSNRLAVAASLLLGLGLILLAGWAFLAASSLLKKGAF